MMCFNNEGVPTDWSLLGLNRDTLPPDETGTFQVLASSYEYSGPCPKYLVAAHGWD